MRVERGRNGAMANQVRDAVDFDGQLRRVGCVHGAGKFGTILAGAQMLPLPVLAVLGLMCTASYVVLFHGDVFGEESPLAGINRALRV